MEKVLESKTCKNCSIKFEITDKDLEFLEKISPTFSGKKYLIPSPSLCPDCRFINRQSFINVRNLYNRKSDLTGKNIISNYSPDKKYKVYESELWFSPDQDFTIYGRDFDFKRPFFEQFNELFLEVPRMSLDKGIKIENGEYNNHVDNIKDCYMCGDINFCNYCFYSSYLLECNNCVDVYKSNKCNECYECISCENSYKLFFSQNCSDSNNSLYLKSCKGCSDCMFCVNLQGKKYHIFNKEYSKEEFYVKKEEIFKNLSKNKEIYLKEFLNFLNNNIKKSSNIINSENATGDEIYNSKNVKESFFVNNGENIAYSFNSNNSKDCFDCDGFGLEKGYYTVITGGGSYNCHFSIAGWDNCKNLFYTDYCFFSSNLFGCVGLKNKEYCILNKAYSKEEYEKLVPKIIEHMQKTGEWGEFFHSSNSPFGYSETMANEYFPMEKEKAQELGFKWSTYEAPLPKVEKIIKASMLPDDIKNVPDDILNWAIECEVTKKSFRIIKQELDFYRKHKLPIPKRNHYVRHFDRMVLKNKKKLFDISCFKCGKNIKSTYNSNENVYCQECYNKNVY